MQKGRVHKGSSIPCKPRRSACQIVSTLQLQGSRQMFNIGIYLIDVVRTPAGSITMEDCFSLKVTQLVDARCIVKITKPSLDYLPRRHSFGMLRGGGCLVFYIFLELSKPGRQTLTFCSFSRLPVSNSLFTVLFADVGYFFFACLVIIDLCRSGCRQNYRVTILLPFLPYQTPSLIGASVVPEDFMI